MAFHDPFGRSINYLRLSVTDQCNLRCLYCVPGKHSHAKKCETALSFPDLLRVARAAVDLGVEKIRVTGGEPLFRKGIVPFLEDLKRIPGLKKLVLTTNGLLLEQMAQDLASAGVDSLNISIDSLVAEKYWRITRGGSLDAVRRGIEATERAGYRNLKINVVVMRGVNDDEVGDFAELTVTKPYKVRFIEYMPTLGRDDAGCTISGEELLARLAENFTLQPVPKEAMDGPAVYYRIAGAMGDIGLITPMSCHFCHECNRIRVTSRGILKGCLFDNGVMDLKPLLELQDDDLLRQTLGNVALGKPERHQFQQTCNDNLVNMVQIGG